MKHVTHLRQCFQQSVCYASAASSSHTQQLRGLGHYNRIEFHHQHILKRCNGTISTSTTPSVPYESSWKGKERAPNEFAAPFSIPRDHTSPSRAPSESVATSSRLTDSSKHSTLGSVTAQQASSSKSSIDTIGLPLRVELDPKTFLPNQESTYRHLYGAPGELGLARKILMAYPSLSHQQATFIADLYDHLHQHGAEACSTLVAWYKQSVSDGALSSTTLQNHIPTDSERNTGNADRISPESAVSLNLMLLCAYRRSDMKSVTVLEARARHKLLHIDPLLCKTGLHRYQLMGDMWPDPTAEPLELAFNIQVALAAKFGLWDKVVSLLETSKASQHSMRFTQATPSTESENRRVEALNKLGWAELLRHGLGREISTPLQQTPTPSARENVVPDLSPRGWQLVNRQMRDWRASNPSRVDADGGKAELYQKNLCIERAARQDNALKLARQRLLSPLVRFTDKEEGPVRLSGEPQATKAPHWMLQATMDNLCANNDTEAVVRIARAALQEMRSLPPNVIEEPYEKKSGVLNAVLKSVPAEQKGGLDQVLHLFHEFTGVDLRRCLTSGRSSSTEETKQMEEPKKESTGTMFFTPSEASLCLILKQVIHPYTRTSTCWKLYQQFRLDFPDVRLSSRTFRLLLMTTVSSPELARPDGATPPIIAPDSRRSWQKKLTNTGPTLKTQAVIQICQEIITYTATLAPRGPENHFHHFQRYLRNASYEDWRSFVTQCRKIQDLVRAVQAYHDQRLATTHAEMLTHDANGTDSNQTDEILEEKARQKRANMERHFSVSTARLDLCITLLDQVQRLR